MTNVASAGRCLDAEVARKVFGWRTCQAGVYDPPESGTPVVCYFCEHPEVGFSCPEEVGHRQDWCYVEGNGLTVVPAFSTDIAAAWCVLDWLRARYGNVQLHGGGDGRWRVIAWGAGRLSAAEADTAALAICRAALEAVVEGPARGAN